MKMEKVESSNISEIGHDPDQNVLHVQFKNGGLYQYHGISADQHAALIGADSIGSHLHHHIKPNAKSVRNATAG